MITYNGICDQEILKHARIMAKITISSQLVQMKNTHTSYKYTKLYIGMHVYRDRIKNDQANKVS